MENKEEGSIYISGFEALFENIKMKIIMEGELKG